MDPLELERIALLKARAEDYERNFFSLRDVEWRVAFQLYAGLAALTAAAFTLSTSGRATPALCLITRLAAIALWLVTQYLSARIQERLHNTRNLMNAYYDQVHLVLSVRPLHLPASATWPPPPPEPIQSTQPRWKRYTASLSGVLNPAISLWPQGGAPIHGRYYAFAAQSILSGVWVAALWFYVGIVCRDALPATVAASPSEVGTVQVCPASVICGHVDTVYVWKTRPKGGPRSACHCPLPTDSAK